MARRETTMLPRGRSILRMAKGCSLPIERADVAHRADVDLRAGQEGRGAAEVDGEAALDAADDRAHDRLVLGVDAFQAGPGFFALGLVAADDRFAHGVLDALQERPRRCRRPSIGGLAGFVDAEFLQLDTRPSVFRPTSMIAKSFSMPDDLALDHRAFHEVAAAHGLVEERGEVVARGLKLISSAMLIFRLQ